MFSSVKMLRMLKYLNYFESGILLTLKLSAFTLVLGSFCGLIIGLMRLSKVKPIRFLASAYINFIRGTPMLVQIYLVYYGLPLGLNNFWAGVVAMTIHSSAYIAEIVRSGIQSVDKGQMEAARSLGMSHSLGMILVVIPQAIKNVLPALCSQFVVIIKNTSLVSVIGMQELMYQTDTVRSITYLAFEPLIIAAVLYFVIGYVINLLAGALERRLKTSD